MQYITKEGDSLDLIAWRYYGQSNEVTELLYKQNQNVSFIGEVLPAGIKIYLSDSFEATSNKVTTYWE